MGLTTGLLPSIFAFLSTDDTRDGKSFLMLRPVAGKEEQLVMVHNFMTELRARRRSQAAAR